MATISIDIRRSVVRPVSANMDSILEDGPGLEFVDIHELFQFYAATYFLPIGCLGACSVHWSSARMTL